MRFVEPRVTAIAACLLAGCGTIGFRTVAMAPAAPPGQPVGHLDAPAAPLAPDVRRAYDDALALLRAGHAAEARQALQTLSRSRPELAGPHANLGLIARQTGHPDEAIAELEQATKLDAREPAMWNQLGIAYREQGQFVKSRAAYEAALALDAGYAAAVLNLGILDDLYLGDGAQALALYTRYLALTPAGDSTVAKWVVDLKNRRPAAAASNGPAAVPKEKS